MDMEQTIGSCIKSFLGPYKGKKFIIDDGNTNLTCCPFQYLQNLPLEHPMVYVLEEALCAHHEEYGTGGTTLLAMWHFWQSASKRLLEKGIQHTAIVKTMQMGLEFVLSHLKSICIPLDTVISQDNAKNELLIKSPGRDICNTSSVSTFTNRSPVLYQQNLSSSVLLHNKNSLTGCSRKHMIDNILLRSRHFTTVDDDDDCHVNKPPNDSPHQNASDGNFTYKRYTQDAVKDIVRKISHGNSQVSSLLCDAWILQLRSQKEDSTIRFTMDTLTSCVISGISSLHCGVVEGLILKVSSSILTSLPSFSLVPLHRILIINGDITQEYTHLGFSPELDITTVSTKLPTSGKDSWMKAVITHLRELGVTVVLAKGKVDSQILDVFIAESILVIDYCSYHTLKVLAKTAGSQVAKYVLGCDERNVASNIKLEPWKPQVFQESHSSKIVYLLLSISAHPLQTVVLCHPSPSVALYIEHQFWHVAHRLQLSTCSRQLLPGGGHTELYCAAMLRKLAFSYRGEEEEILNAFSEGLVHFYQAVLTNLEVGLETPCSCNIDTVANFKWNDFLTHKLQAYDCLQPKTEAWRAALKLSSLFLQTDAVIINGCDGETLHIAWTGAKFVGKI